MVVFYFSSVLDVFFWGFFNLYFFNLEMYIVFLEDKDCVFKYKWDSIFGFIFVFR